MTLRNWKMDDGQGEGGQEGRGLSSLIELLLVVGGRAQKAERERERCSVLHVSPLSFSWVADSSWIFLLSLAF